MLVASRVIPLRLRGIHQIVSRPGELGKYDWLKARVIENTPIEGGAE
jgi:hypothetical protein